MGCRRRSRPNQQVGTGCAQSRSEAGQEAGIDLTDILSLPGLAVDPGRTREDGSSITIGVGRRPKAEWCCNHCSVDALVPNGARLVRYADLPVRGKPVTLEWQRQRFRCTACGKSTPDRHEALHDDFLMTVRLYDWIGSRCLKTTFAAVAADVGLDERSVRRVFEHWATGRLKNRQVATPRWLGVDEVHLLHAARGILCDIQEKTLIDMLPTRSRDTMARRIMLMAGRERVEVVAMDMWAPYRQIAAELLPQAVVVVDKWHVTKYADLGMETIRKSHRASLTPLMRRRLVKDRFLLLSRGHRLSPEQRLIMETWTNAFPDLAAAYAAKEAFYNVYDQPDRAAAHEACEAWAASLTPDMRVAFGPLLSALRNWHEPIFNYFDNRATNAYTEAMNGLIKIANRAGRGYSFDVLRARMLLSRDAVKYTGTPIGMAPSGDYDRPAGEHIPTLTDQLIHGELGFLPTGFAG